MSWGDWWDIKVMDFLAFLYLFLGFIVLVVVGGIRHFIVEYIRNRIK